MYHIAIIFSSREVEVFLIRIIRRLANRRETARDLECRRDKRPAILITEREMTINKSIIHLVDYFFVAKTSY
jgi:hypothetical protein